MFSLLQKVVLFGTLLGGAGYLAYYSKSWIDSSHNANKYSSETQKFIKATVQSICDRNGIEYPEAVLNSTIQDISRKYVQEPLPADNLTEFERNQFFQKLLQKIIVQIQPTSNNNSSTQQLSEPIDIAVYYIRILLAYPNEWLDMKEFQRRKYQIERAETDLETVKQAQSCCEKANSNLITTGCDPAAFLVANGLLQKGFFHLQTIPCFTCNLRSGYFLSKGAFMVLNAALGCQTAARIASKLDFKLPMSGGQIGMIGKGLVLINAQMVAKLGSDIKEAKTALEHAIASATEEFEQHHDSCVKVVYSFQYAVEILIMTLFHLCYSPDFYKLMAQEYKIDNYSFSDINVKKLSEYQALREIKTKLFCERPEPHIHNTLFKKGKRILPKIFPNQ